MTTILLYPFSSSIYPNQSSLLLRMTFTSTTIGRHQTGPSEVFSFFFFCGTEGWGKGQSARPHGRTSMLAGYWRWRDTLSFTRTEENAIATGVNRTDERTREMAWGNVREPAEGPHEEYDKVVLVASCLSICLATCLVEGMATITRPLPGHALGLLWS